MAHGWDGGIFLAFSLYIGVISVPSLNFVIGWWGRDREKRIPISVSMLEILFYLCLEYGMHICASMCYAHPSP